MSVHAQTLTEESTTPVNQPSLRISNLSKVFVTERGSVPALDDVSLDIDAGEFVTVIGPSGCGKSTLLKIVAGLEPPSQGLVRLDAEPVVKPGNDRAVIFQEHRLLPWATVEKNVAANLSLRDRKIRRAVDDLLEITGLQDFKKSYPKELSGGMLQRVSIARALLREPKVLLLDEPFGALDAFTRAKMQGVLSEIWRTRGITMIFVTHDIDEAVRLGDRIILMSPRPGRIYRTLEGLPREHRAEVSGAHEALNEQIKAHFAAIGSL